MSGCTDCGRKGGCEDRKGGMMTAIDEALGRLYPSRRWSERDQEAGDLVCVEAPRSGVFDPILLPRMQKLVAVLSSLEVRHLDFGDLTQPPPGFEGGDYESRYGNRPALVNYLFFPQPASAITT